MTPAKVKKRIVSQRAEYVSDMVSEIRSLPLESRELFLSDRRNVWAAESCLRRAIEALLDLGRHILSKCFGRGVTEYKQIADQLEQRGVLTPEHASILRLLAGYRNRMVHFYQEITPEELYVISSNQLEDLLAVRDGLLTWLRSRPEHLDEIL